MSVTAAIRELLDAGFTIDQALKAAEVMEKHAANDHALDRRRASDAERQRKYRESQRNVMSRDNVTDEAKKEIPPTPPKEKNINIYTPESSNELSTPKRNRRKPETPLPADCPTAEQITDAETRANAAGVDIKIKFQAERFRNHAQTTDRRCRDWGAAWRNWVSMAIDRAGGRPAGEKPPEAVPRSDLIRAYRHSGTWPSEWGERPTPEELAA